MIPAHRRQIEKLYRAACNPARRARVVAAAGSKLRREVEFRLAHDSSKMGLWTSLHGLLLAGSPQ